MPVSIGEWRVRIGSFIHRVREYDIRERKEKLLKERIRLLKLLEKRLLEKKENSEGECESKQNVSSAKVENAPNEPSIINKDMPTDSHKEDSCSGSESTIEDNTTQTESTTNHKSNGTVSTIPFFFTLLLPLFTLLLSLIFFFFVFDFSNLLESCKPFLKWSGESTWRITCLIIIIVCSSFAYIVFSYVMKDNDDLQDSLVVIKDDIAKAESTIKVKNTTSKTTVKSNNSPTEGNIKENNTGSELTTKENSTPTKSIIANNNTVTESRFKEKNTTIQSTKECNNTSMNDIIKERNTPSIIRDEPSERKTSKTTTSNRKAIKEENTITKFTIKEKSALPESKIRGRVAVKECHIDTLSIMTDKPSKRKTQKGKTLTSKRKTQKGKTLTSKRKTSKKKTAKEKKRAIKTTIKANNSPTESNIKEDNMLSESTSKEKITQIKSTLKKDNTRNTESTIRKNNSPNESNMKENTTKTGSTIKEKSASTESSIKSKSISTKTTIRNNSSSESTIKDNNTPTESNIKEYNTPTESTIKENNTPTECTMKENNTPTESTIKENNTPTESTIKENNTPTEFTIKENNTPTESTIKETNTPTECTMKENNTPTECTIKEYNTSTECTIKENGTPTKSTIKENNTPSESNIKENNTPTESTIKENNTPIECTIKEYNTSTESIITKNNATTESTIKEKNSLTESTNKNNDRSSECTIKDYSNQIEFNIKDNNSTIQSIKEKNNTTGESANKGSNSTKESTIKDSNTLIESTLKGTSSTTSIIGSPTEYTNESNNHSSESPIKGNNSRSKSTPKDINTTSISAIKEKNTPSIAPTGERNNQPNKVNSVQAEYTIGSGTQKVPSDGKHSISSQILSSLKGTTDDPVMQESTCLPEMILVKAGDVEQNPGPFDRSAKIQERELINLAYDVPSSKYTELCSALGVLYNQSQTILDRHLLDFTRSLHAVFFQWKDRQKDGTDCRRVIAVVLRDVNLDALADKMSRGGYLPQEAAPESAVGEETQPLTKEQVDQCAQDFRTFYRTRLCKIKTDPLDFNSILEFDRIYTNLVLLRNEMGTTKKTPLDYTKLLTTKVNGVFPKRLMVEGEGGAGKTTFCSKIAWDWAERTKEFEEFDWVLVIPFRNAKEGQTVGDIAKTYLSDSNTVQPCQIDKYILSAPSKVFIIFDGLDEYEGDILKESSDIAKILRSEKFVECRVLVTTRQWRVVPYKSNEIMMQTFVFLAIAGFDKKNISTYIAKYFQDEPPAGHELINYIESNDLIQENMAPFPLYIAMLCILWRNSDANKRNVIRKLKTFSELFKAMIIFLKDHCLTKQHQNPNVKILTNKEMNNYLSQIGKIAYSGVLKKKLTYTENDFSGYDEAMEACCRIGVLSREIFIVPRQDRRLSETDPVTWSIFFPHKMFQEYLAGMYLASLFESDHEQYETDISDVIPRANEFRYLLYFTASQSKNVAIDVTNRLINMGTQSMERHILVDIAFEGCDEDSAKIVGQHLFKQKMSLHVEISDEMSAHTVSGYLFILEKITMETLILSRRSCGPTVSRDLADVICSSTALRALELSRTALHDDFYGTLESKVKTSKVERLSLRRMEISDEHASRNLARFLNSLPRLKDLTLQNNRFDGRFYEELASGACLVGLGASGHSVRKLHLDHLSHNDILQHSYTVERLFPNLEHLHFTTLQTVSPNIVGSFAHSGLKELSFAGIDYGQTEGDEEHPVPMVGDLSSLEQVFRNSFPRLTDLTLKNLVIGNNRCKLILGSLKQHQHMKNLCIIRCYTDEELDHIVSAINMENRMKVDIQHEQAQKRLECMKMSSSLADALCNRTSIQELSLTDTTVFSNAWFSEENQRTVDSKIQKLSIVFCFHGMNDPPALRDLATFLCLQPCLTDLKINCYSGYLHDDFYQELARLASSSKVHNLSMGGCKLESNIPSASRDLARFFCLQPCLTYLTIDGYIYRHDDFYKELSSLASFSKVQKLSMSGCNLERNNPSASRNLATFLCLQPCLTDLMINWYNGYLHDDFYQEIARLASSSKVQKLYMGCCMRESNTPSGSRDLATFLCIQPCLTDLTIDLYTYQHDVFYQGLSRLASSSKIQKLFIEDCNLGRHDPTSSRDLAKFLCLQPCLTDLTINGYEGHSDFYHELALLAPSSKNHFFNKKLHLDERSEEWKEMDLRQQIEYIRHLVHPTWSEITPRPTSRAPEPLSSHRGSEQQQIEYSSIVTPSDIDVPSTSGINAHSGKITEVSQNIPSTVTRHLEAADSSRLTGNTIIGQQININCPGHSSKDDSVGGSPGKRKKTNRKTDSTEEDERTRGENQKKSHGSGDGSLDGRPRKRKKKTNRD